MAACGPWWRNCALVADAEILEIDRLENEIAPLAEPASRIRALISTLELCHHKAECWIDNIIAAIGSGDTRKGLGTRQPGRFHPAEELWQSACASLSSWCAGCAGASVGLSVGAVPAPQLLACLGPRSALKEWQVQRVIEKIRGSIGWPPPCQEAYVWMLFDGGDYEPAYRRQCPERYQEHEEFWLATARTMIHDTENGDPAALSLGLAIDMLWPCHWSFVENLQIVLAAIGGRLQPVRPFAACGRNITLLPIRERMERVSKTLSVFCGRAYQGAESDRRILALLGEPAEVKRWLAASLDKTIRLQMSPPPEVRKLSALAGPAWIRQ